MTRGPSILVLGDPGPVRHEILLRAELEVFWISKLEEALALLREVKPRLCLVSPETPMREAAMLFDLLAQSGVPGILLTDESMLIDASVASRALAAVPVGQVETILGQVAARTGLVFAREARRPFSAPVRVRLDGVEQLAQATDLSLSGMGLRGFPEILPGTEVELCFPLDGAELTLRARVARWTIDGHTTVAGVYFLDAESAVRDRLLVALGGAGRPGPSAMLADLFADLALDDHALGELRTEDIRPDPQDIAALTESTDLEVSALRGLLVKSGGSRPDLPEWLLRLSAELTEVERGAVLGEPCPSWVEAALHLRLRLARYRSLRRQVKLPSSLADEAYRMFVRLGARAGSAPPALIAQLSKIRAAILRDMLATDPFRRSGAEATLRAKLDEEIQAFERARALPLDTRLGQA